MKKISRWTKIAAAAALAVGMTSAFATDCTPQSPQYCTPQQLAQLQAQAQQQVTNARAELAAALTNLNSVTANPTATSDAQAAAQARVTAATNSLSTAQGGMAALNGTVQGTNTLTAAPNNAGGANVVTNTSNNTRITTLEPAKPIAPTVVPAPGATAVSEPQCGPLRMIRKTPLEYFFVGHTEESKVSLRGQTTDEAVDFYDEVSQGFKDEEIKRYPNGMVVHYGSIATIVSVTLSGSVTKQFGFGGASARGEGATVNNGVSSGFTIEKKSIYLARCELQKYRVEEIVPVIPKVTPTDICPNIEGLQTAVPQGMMKDGVGNCVVPPSKSAALEPALDKKPAPFVTGQRIHMGPQDPDPRLEHSCPVTQPNGSVKWVPKKHPKQYCGSRLVTAPALTPETNLVTKPAAVAGTNGAQR